MVAVGICFCLMTNKENYFKEIYIMYFSILIYLFPFFILNLEQKEKYLESKQDQESNEKDQLKKWYEIRDFIMTLGADYFFSLKKNR